MFARLLAALSLFVVGSGFAQTAKSYQEGIDYSRLPRAMPVTTGERIEVLEAFSYSCIHCAEADPHITRWKASAPANAQLVLLPIAWNPDWELSARAFYAAEALKALDRTHKATFDARFQQRKTLSTVEDFASLYASLGVDRAKFLSTFKSFGVNTKIKRSQQLAREFGIANTPTFIVDGKFQLNFKTPAELPELINFVVAKAAAERGAK